MSIQGWFHSPKPPTDADLATLKQLQACPGEDDILDMFEPLKWTNNSSTSSFISDTVSDGIDPAGLPTDAPLCATDVALLREWINPVYLDASDAAINKIHKCILDDGSVQLHDFLCASKAKEIGAAIVAADAADALGNGKVPKYTAGFENGWSAVGPCHKQRYMEYSTTREKSHSSSNSSSPLSTAGELLNKIKIELFSSPSFARLLHRVTDFTLTHYRAESRRFRPGLDYTVAHYGCLTQDPRLDAVLCFVADGAQGAREAWESGELGGYEAYLLADEDEEKPAEVYRGPQDDESGVLNVSPAFNCLSLVLRDEGLMRFVKFLSAHAPGSRWDVSGVYIPEDD
jgi:hypothetical protein